MSFFCVFPCLKTNNSSCTYEEIWVHKRQRQCMRASVHTLHFVLRRRKMSLWSIHSCISLCIPPPPHCWLPLPSDRKQMGDLCCGLLPNGANSHYSVCKLCLFSPCFTSTPCTTLPSDVLNTCLRCRRVILMCLVLLIRYLSSFFL